MFNYVDLSKYVRPSPRYGNKKFLSYYSFLSLFKNKEFWQRIESLAKTEDLRMTLRGFNVIRGHGLLGLALLSQYILNKYRTVPVVEFPEDHLIGPLEPRFLDSYFSPACPFTVSNRATIERMIPIEASTRRHFPLGFSEVNNKTIGSLIEQIERSTNYGGTLAHDMGGGRSSDVDRAIKVIGSIIAEVVRNVVMHSEPEPNEGRGYLLVEKTSRGLTISIGDIGVGIRSSLASKGTPSSNDTQAIKKALLYREREATSEVNLTGLFGIAWHIKEIGGELLIRSDSSSVRLLSGATFSVTHAVVSDWIRDSTRRSFQSNLYAGFPGTQIIVDIKSEKAGM